MLVSKLAEDNLSDDKDEGIGGTFTGGGLDSLSDEALLLSDREEGLLVSPRSVSLLFSCRIALSGRLVDLFCRGGRFSGDGLTTDVVLSSDSPTFEDVEKGLDATGGGAATGSETIDIDCFWSGEMFRDLARFLASFGEGEGDLEDDVFHDLLARLRNVLDTERPVEDFGLSGTLIAAGLLVSFAVALPRSSAESVNLVTAIFPFPLLDALRSSSLLGIYGDCPVLGDPLGERANTLSEKVRLIPSVGCESCTPGRCVKLAERGKPLNSSCLQ